MNEQVRKTRALAGGYFWLPCPTCGENFGGDEWDHKNTLWDGTEGTGICSRCGDILRKAAKIGSLESSRNSIVVDVSR